MDNNIFNKKDLEIMNTFFTERCISKRTQYGYHNAFHLYIQYTGMHLQDLLLEADIEEEKGIRWKKSKLKAKIIGFRGWLREKYKYSTLKIMFGRIKTFYNHFEIEMGFIPKLNEKQLLKVNLLHMMTYPQKKC